MQDSLISNDENFSDIYIYDDEVEKRINEMVNSNEVAELVKRAKDLKSVFPLLDEILPARKKHPLDQLVSRLHPFYVRAEYRTKEDYLQHLKEVYGFLQDPMENPPSTIMSLFYPNLKKSWRPSYDIARELLVRFYVEVKLISELSRREWDMVASSQNPEMMINHLVFRMRLKPDFEHLLKKIPWVVAHDAYGAPGLDLIWRHAPGNKLPKKPFGVDYGYLKKLAQSNMENKAYLVLWENEKRIRLRNAEQIVRLIKKESSATLDSFLGLSKVERDFVVHKHIIIWENPGMKGYRKAPRYKRFLYQRPSPFLCIIREEALPLEIPALAAKTKGP